MTRVNSYVQMNSRNISFHNYIDILNFWLPKSPVLVYKGISISDGQISRDCIPEAQTLLLTPISSYNDHYGQNGRLAIWPIMAILTIMAIQAIFAIMGGNLTFDSLFSLWQAQIRG